MLLSENNVKSELSYAYLHAVASHAGLGCEVAGRHSDDAGVDAVVRAKERFYPDSIYTHFTMEVQLKATSVCPEPDRLGRYPFRLLLNHYDKLRDEGNWAQQILVVLFLPSERPLWLSHSADSLITRRCAYWVSLRGAPESPNDESQTVYIPQSNLFSVEGLRSVMARVSRGERIVYEL
jgi:hypothetical protein